MTKHDKTRQLINKLEATDYIAAHLTDYDRNMVVIAEATALANALARVNLAMDHYNPDYSSTQNWRYEAEVHWNRLNAAIETVWLEQTPETQESWLLNWKANIEKCVVPPIAPEQPQPAQEETRFNVDGTTYKKELQEEDEELLRPFFPELEEDTQNDKQ